MTDDSKILNKIRKKKSQGVSKKVRKKKHLNLDLGPGRDIESISL